MATKKTTPKRPAAPKRVAQPVDEYVEATAESEDEPQPGDQRRVEKDYDVVIIEEYVERARIDRQRNTTYTDVYWQPVAKETPCLLITNPLAWTGKHEELLRREYHLDKPQRRIRGAVKKHAEGGELWFELGRSDAEMDEMIAYAIELLKGAGIQATRAIRTSSVVSRGTW